MALTKYNGPNVIIGDLENQPNDSGEHPLSPQALKDKFDEFGTTFKEYFNNTFVPEVEAALDSAAAGIGMTQKLNGSAITDGTVTLSKLSDSAGFEAVDTSVVRDGAVSKPKLSIGVQATLDAVDGKTTHIATSAELLSDGWTDNEQTVTVQGVTAYNIVIATGSVDADDVSHNAWSNCDIHAVAQGSNSLTFRCRTVPSSDVSVNILILNQGG